MKLSDLPDRNHMMRAAVTMGIILAVLWIVQFISVADNYVLDAWFGIQPHVLTSLPNIFTAPFLHASWAHIEGNSVPLLVLGFLAAYRSLVKFAWVTAIVIVFAGLFVWLTAPTGSYTTGASGVIAGWLGYVMLRGVFDRRKIDIIIGAVAGFLYLGSFEFVPNDQNISWQGHLSGLVAGMLCAWLVGDRTPIASLINKTRTMTAGRGRPIAIASAAFLIVAATVGISLAAANSTAPQSAPVAAQPAPTDTAAPADPPTDPAPTDLAPTDAVPPADPAPTQAPTDQALAAAPTPTSVAPIGVPSVTPQPTFTCRVVSGFEGTSGQGALLSGTPGAQTVLTKIQFYAGDNPVFRIDFPTVQLDASGRQTIWAGVSLTNATSCTVESS